MKIIDLHHYYGRSLFGHNTSRAKLLRSMDAFGIERAFLCPVKPTGYRLPPENKRVSKVVAAHGDRFSGWCRVDPWQKRALDHFRQGIEELGLCGLFLHPWEENFPITTSLVDPLFEAAQSYGVPVMVVGGHVRVSTAWQIGEVARRHPAVTIIATSGGQINISGAALAEAEVMLTECPNVFMETSGIYREDFIEDMAKKFGAQRVYFGSGSPVFSLAMELKRGQWADLPQTDRAAILAGNTASLFGE